MPSFSKMQTIKITLKALILLRLIGVKTGEKQYAIMHRVLAQDAARLAAEPAIFGPIPADTPQVYLAA